MRETRRHSIWLLAIFLFIVSFWYFTRQDYNVDIVHNTVANEINEVPILREKRSGRDAVVVLKTIFLHSPISQNWMTNLVHKRVSNLGGGGARVRGFNMGGYFAAEIIVPNGQSACDGIQGYAKNAAKTRELQAVFFRCGRDKAIQYKRG